MRSRTRFGWFVTLMSLLSLALVVGGISVLVLSRADDPVPAAEADIASQQLPQPTATAPLPPGNDWTQYRYDLVGTGVNPEDSISASNVGQLRSAWVYDNKGAPYESTPAIVDGVVYMPSGNALGAYDLRTGAKLWTFTGITPTQGVISSSVAVDTSRHLAYFGAPSNYVYAVDTLTGRGIWAIKLGEIDQGAYIWSSPLLANNTVYIGLASRGDHPCVRGAMFALDAGNGTLRWTHYTAPENEIGGGIWSTATADPDEHTILVTTGNPCTSWYSSTEQDSIVAIDWDTGKTAWKYTALEYDDCDCDFGQGTVTYTLNGQKYIVAGNKFGKVYGLVRTATGVRLTWSTRIADSDATYLTGIFQPPAYKDGVIYIGSGTLLDGSCAGAVWALRGDTGAMVWKRCTPKSVVSPGAITGDVLFVANRSGELNAYELKTGNVLWHAPVPGEIFGGTAVSHGYVVVGSVRGKLYCFKIGAG